MSSELQSFAAVFVFAAFLWPRGWWAGPLSLRKVTAKLTKITESLPHVKWRVQEIHGARRRERAAVLRHLRPRGRGGERDVHARQEYYLAVVAVILNRAHQPSDTVCVSHMHVLPLLNEIPPPYKCLYRSSCTWT